MKSIETIKDKRFLTLLDEVDTQIQLENARKFLKRIQGYIETIIKQEKEL